MKKKDIGPYKKALLELKETLLKEVLLIQESDKEGDGEIGDQADQAAESYERELASSLSETERARLLLVEQALIRVDKGGYGECETCEKSIPVARLKALPFARLCVSCQEIEERVPR